MRSIACRFALVALTVAIVGISTGYCSDPATHMAVAKRSLVVWQDFDPAFYAVITGNPTTPYARWVQKMALKFYYIGTTLPDLFWDGQQSAATDLIAWLYSEGGWFWPDWPLHIEQTTFDATRASMNFPGHHSLEVLERMAQYARSQNNWTTVEKAMIYGAYFHAIEDRYGHMVMQPSRFGHGFALYDASNLAFPNPDPMEQYHELFAGTHIQNDDYQPLAFILFWGPYRWAPDTMVEYADASFGMEFYRELLGTQVHKTWQTSTFPAITRFVEAANRYGACLTHDQLRGYMHAWAMALGLAYGYWPQNYPYAQGPYSGGIVGHPTWTPQFITAEGGHLYHMVTPYTIGSFLPDVVGGLRQRLWQNIVKRWLDWVSSPTQGGAAWTSYFETEQGIWNMWWLIPENERTQERYQAMLLLSHKVAYLDQWSSPDGTKPNMRMTYQSELPDETSLQGLLRNAVSEGRNGIDYNKSGQDQLSRSWKSMLLGGMYEIQNPDWYFRQPGVLEAGFKKDGQPCWTELTVGLQGDPVRVSLAMDLVTFGGTRVRMVGKTQGGQEIDLQPYVPDCMVASRWKINQPYNLQDAANSGATQVSFKVFTKNKYGGDFQLMLGSDYYGTYHGHQAIEGNPFYQQLFNIGDPFRLPSQNPFTNPRAFWPYAVRLNVVNWYLNAPSCLTAALRHSSPTAIVLDWRDNSSFEYGYRVEKTVDNFPPSYIPPVGQPPLPAGTTHFEDIDVTVGPRYRYRVWAERGSDASERTPYVELTLAASAEYPLTAYNNADKIVTRGNDVHITYFAGPQGAHSVMYLHSSDGGSSWDSPENVSGPCELREGRFPSIALGTAGEPYVLWPRTWYYSWVFHHWYMPYYVSWRTEGVWDSTEAFSFRGGQDYNKGPTFVPPQASFCVRGESGFAALDFHEHPDVTNPTESGTYYVQFWLPPHPGGGPLVRIAFASNWGGPVMLVDNSGRKVVVSTHYDGGLDRIRISYKDVGATQFASYLASSLYPPDAPCNMTGILENGANVLLAWTTPGGAEPGLKFARFVKRSEPPPNEYRPDPAAELVSNEGIYDDTRPKFIANSMGMPVLVYENGNDGGIWYALRTQPGSWLRGVVFTSDYYLSYPQGFCVGNRLCVYASAAEPPGNPPYYLMTGSVTLPRHQIPAVAIAYATGPNSGRMLAVQPGGEIVHVVYDAGDSVQYAVSRDGGETWGEPSQIDFGDHPSIALDAAGLPTIVYARHDSIFCKVRRADSTWREMMVYAGDIWRAVGPPAVARLQATATTSCSYCAFPVYDLNVNSSQVWLAKLDTLQFQLELMAETTGALADSFVSIACTPDGPVHVAWQRADRVMCVTDSMPSGPFGGCDAQPTLVQVSTEPAGHPFIEAYGDLLYIVWCDRQSGSVVRTSRYVWDALSSWVQPTPVSGPADFPVCSKSGVSIWEQPDYCGQGDIWANVCGPLYNLSESPNISSKYPHLDVGVNLYGTGYGTVAVVDTIYSIWTENVDESLYSVRFRKLGVQGTTDGLPPAAPSHSLFCGRETASTYCLFRSGRDSSGGVGFDYGNDSLSYRMRYLDPRYNYLAEFTVAHNKRLFFEQSVRARGEEIARVRFGPKKPDTVRLVIPRRFYENGATLPFSLRRLTGEYAALAGLKLYAFEPRRTRPGGVMAGVTPVLLEPRLYDVAPCPSRGATMLRYQIPRPTHVTLKIYDASGRSVRTVLDSERPAGVYTVAWDGRDQRGRVTANGIYFCRMKAGDYKDGKKLVISR